MNTATLSAYATTEETASVMRQATPDELWLHAQLDRIAPDRHEMGSASDNDALVKLVFELRDNQAAYRKDSPTSASELGVEIDKAKTDQAMFGCGFLVNGWHVPAALVACWGMSRTTAASEACTHEHTSVNWDYVQCKGCGAVKMDGAGVGWHASLAHARNFKRGY